MADLLIGIDFGGTHIKVGCFDEALRLHKRGSVATEVDMGPTLVVDHIVGAITALLDCTGHKLGDIRAAGIGIPGPADYQAGILINSTHMPGFRNTPLRQMLIDRLHCPVAFNSDTNVACFGEFTAGAGEDVDDMVFFTLGTGIGCGIISHGKLIQGATGSAAGVGHVIVYPEGEPCNCGQRGCAEAYASAANTARRARAAIEAGATSSLASLEEISCKDVYQHLARGDALARRITDDTAGALALLCVNMLHVTDPARIVFAGGMIGAGPALLTPIRERFDQLIWRIRRETVEIVFASLGPDAGIIGAAAMAREATQEGPS